MKNGFKRLSKFPVFLLLFALVICFGVTPASAASQKLTNDVFWKDTAGNPIYSQGGGVLKVGNTYYWYGVKYNGAVTYYNNPTSLNSDSSFNAITCYSSTDLVHWKFEGNVVTAATDGSTWDADWIGRVGVAYNSNTQKYVLVTQYQGPNGKGTAFATSSTPTGTFTYNSLQPIITNVINERTGDQSVFIDDDGKAYLVYSNRAGRANIYISALRPSDYLNVEPATQILNVPAGREGNAMFKYNGVYYVCGSELHGWNASKTYCISSTNIYGPYSSEFVMGNTDKDFSHVTQTGLFVSVQGTSGTTILFGGDRWSNLAGNGIGYNQWMPLSFNGTTPSMNSLSEFNLDAAAGTWSVGSGNNYALNPSYEADRVAQNSLAGWTTWTNATTNPNANALGGHSGRWSAKQSGTAAYSATRYQDLTNLPNGTYTLKAWVKSSGGQSTAYIYVSNYGGSELRYNVNSAISSWTQITIPNINVTNGKARIALYSVANAGNWVNVDDWSLVKN
ncbi:family 43 glycosylhydrolase [Paenibacillus sp. Soil750]|uniref:family 43 glycosylhydrolase n=1 Tax=Paenibacillus sp. Soil750 TaxID=1736398 RepID=UPI0006FB69EF|nr:family 43 glycosylhydrolase [Paenibacillus sp. Soil750]KRE69737.1 beta-xylosidase [Paenibacillus sp. Soil750]